MQQEIIRLEEERIRALLQGDLAALDEMLAEDFIHTTSAGKVRGKAEFLANFKARDFAFDSFVIDENSIRVYGDAAVVAGSYHNNVRYDGEAMPLKRARHLRVYIKRQGRWQLVAHQATAIKQDA